MISGAPTYGNVYGYNGEPYNVQTQHLYLRARYYNTARGRFTSKDSYLGDITEPPPMNRYPYELGNPMNYMDPSGHAASDLPTYGGRSTTDIMSSGVIRGAASNPTKLKEVYNRSRATEPALG